VPCCSVGTIGVSGFLARNKPSPPLPIELLECRWSVLTDPKRSSDDSALFGPRLVRTGFTHSPGIGICVTMRAPLPDVPD
jgi:hypothetical protein